MRTPVLAIALIGAALVAAGLLVGSGADRGDAPKRATISPAGVDRIAARVERIRGRRFRRRPVPRYISARGTRAKFHERLDEDYPPARRRADERVLQLLGLIPPGARVDELLDAIAEEGVAGFYDPDAGRLFVVREAAVGPATLEVTLAHELAHALDDQSLGLHEPGSGLEDAPSAYAALVEGSATHVQTRYMERHTRSLGLLVESLGLSLGPDLPEYIMNGLLFPYLSGEAFVRHLYERTGDWSLVDFAIGKRPPDSTEQILHPEKYLRFERPLTVRLGEPGGGWRRRASGTIGEFDTRELVDDAAAAAGWGGGRFALWRRGRDDLLTLAWRMDTVRDAVELESALAAHARGRPRKGAAVLRRGDAVVLVVAADAAEARSEARRAVAAGR